MYFDRFDVCEAWAAYMAENHGGMNDPLYARLCRLLSFYRPAHLGRLSNENAQAIYSALCKRSQDRSRYFTRRDALTAPHGWSFAETDCGE